MDSSEHFTAVAANDNLREAVVAAITAFLTIGAGLNYSPAHQFFLYTHVNLSWDNRFVVSFNIILRNDAGVLDSGLVQEVCGISFLEQGIADVFLVSEDFVDGAGPPFCFASAGEDAVCFQTFCNPVHIVKALS